MWSVKHTTYYVHTTISMYVRSLDCFTLSLVVRVRSRSCFSVFSSRVSHHFVFCIKSAYQCIGTVLLVHNGIAQDNVPTITMTAVYFTRITAGFKGLGKWRGMACDAHHAHRVRSLSYFVLSTSTSSFYGWSVCLEHTNTGIRTSFIYQVDGTIDLSSEWALRQLSCRML